MKIKTENISYEKALNLEPYRNRKPVKQGMFWRWLLRTASMPELKKVAFSCVERDMDRLGKGEPALYLMNHSSFIDLKIAASIIYPRPFHIVCTLDGFVGKEGLMRRIGCIPTRKFMADTTLVRDMISIGTPKVQYYCFPKNKDAIVAKARLATEELYKLSKTGRQLRKDKEQ